MAKLFLGGLSPQTTEEVIRDYFGRFGTITDAVAMKGPDGRPRGFGFVTFEDPQSADMVIAEGRPDIDGKSVEIKRADGKGDGPRGHGAGSARPSAAMHRPIYADPGWPPSHYNPPPQHRQYQAYTPPPQPMARGFPDGQKGGPREYDPGPGQAKLFLGGISKSTTTEDIRAYFSQYGDITDAVAMKQQDGTPRGFGFVTFADGQVAEAVLQGTHELDGKTLDIKPTTKEGSAAPMARNSGAGPPGGQRTDKVFVGGLDKEKCTHDDLVGHFAQYGTIIDAVVMMDKERGVSRGFGFVQYDNTDSVEDVMRDYDKHNICDSWVEVKRSVPKDRMEAAKGKGGGKGGFGNAYIGGGRGPYGAPPMQSKGYFGDPYFGKGGHAPMMGKGYGDPYMAGHYGKGGPRTAAGFLERPRAHPYL